MKIPNLDNIYYSLGYHNSTDRASSLSFGDRESIGINIGNKDFANNVVELCNKTKKNNFKFLYSAETPLLEKIEAIAKEIYGASKVEADDKIKDQIKKIEEAGFGKFPVCIAKTQYSFSTDPKLKGAPSGHALPIREIRLSSGAEFVVVICGAIMTMPGLPRVPAADSIKLNDEGEIEGLF